MVWQKRFRYQASAHLYCWVGCFSVVFRWLVGWPVKHSISMSTNHLQFWGCKSWCVRSWRKRKSQQTLSTDGGMKCLFLIENLLVDTALTLDIVHLLPPRLTDCTAPYIITDWRNFTMDFKHLGFCTSALFIKILGTWFPINWKEDFGPLSISQINFSLPQVVNGLILT